jgi:UDP:flavonoid glycosyltransferase YjiC (YdhE family)
MPVELTAEAIRGAVRSLLDDPRYAEAVRKQRSSIDSMPYPEEVVPVLEALA